MDSDGDSDSFIEEESSSSEDEDRDEEYWFNTNLQGIRENNPVVTELRGSGGFERIENMTDEEWEELGRDISNDANLGTIDLIDSALNDHRMTSFFRGLTRSDTIYEVFLYRNGFSVAGVRSMTPFLRNANNLTMLDLDDNNLQSEGVTFLMRALSNSPIKELRCNRCGIGPIEIDRERSPQHLTHLRLKGNKIDTEGCRGLAKLLQGADSVLTDLDLRNNQIDDEGVAILMNSLQNNTSLKDLELIENERISVEGMRLCLRLVNDISSIKATLQSNHTLTYIRLKNIHYDCYNHDDVIAQTQRQIGNAIRINRNYRNDPEAAGKEKLQIQLSSEIRAELAKVQGVDRSLYSEINPLHLPEVLALVGKHHGQGELYVALKSSIAEVISTVNRKECIQQQMNYYDARLEALGAELAAINEAEGGARSESRSYKRRRA